MDQFVKVRMDEREIRSAKTERGVRQGQCQSPILFKLCKEYLTEKALEVFEDFRLRRQIIRNAKYADDIMLLAQVETVVPDTLDRLIDIGLYCEMEINVEETEVMKVSRSPFPCRI